MNAPRPNLLGEAYFCVRDPIARLFPGGLQLLRVSTAVQIAHAEGDKHDDGGRKTAADQRLAELLAEDQRAGDEDEIGEADAQLGGVDAVVGGGAHEGADDGGDDEGAGQFEVDRDVRDMPGEPGIRVHRDDQK